jgi:hypothetical protein
MDKEQEPQWLDGLINARRLEKELMTEIVDELKAQQCCNQDTLWKQARWDTRLVLWDSKYQTPRWLIHTDSANSATTRGRLA